VSILVIASSRFVERQLAALRALAPHERFVTDPATEPTEGVEAIVAYRLAAGIAPRFPGLRFVASPGAGVDELLASDIPPQVPIVRALDPAQGQRMAQYVALMVLRRQRELSRLETQHRSGEWRRFTPAEEKTIGVMGHGSFGAPVVATLRTLGFPVAVWTRNARPIDGVDVFSGEAGLGAFLARSEVLVCTLPLTAGTRGLLCAKTLAQLPRGAYLINVSRGGLLVEADLVAAIDSKHLAGAALDVFAIEPLPPDSPLWRREEILCTPHIAAEPRPEVVGRQLLDNLQRVRRGEPLINAVDRGRGY
jgi:phosphoglycerate dehydrogenase-like enzyme